MTMTSAWAGAAAISASGVGVQTATALAGISAGKASSRVIDPAQPEWQRRERERKRAADMARAEEQDRRVVVAEPLDDDAPRPAKIGLTRGQEIGIVERQPQPRDPARLVEGRLGLESRRQFSRGEFSDHPGVGAVEGLDQRGHPSAAALAEIGPERPVAHLRAGRVRQRAHLRASPDQFPLQRAAADRSPEPAIRPQHHPRARLARRRAGDSDDADQGGGAMRVRSSPCMRPQTSIG